MQTNSLTQPQCGLGFGVKLILWIIRFKCTNGQHATYGVCCVTADMLAAPNLNVVLFYITARLVLLTTSPLGDLAPL